MCSGFPTASYGNAAARTLLQVQRGHGLQWRRPGHGINGCCGFYLAVDQPGHLLAGETFDLLPGPPRLRITEMSDARMFKPLR